MLTSQVVLELPYNRSSKDAEAITKHFDPVCSACVFFTRVSLPKCWFWLVSRPWKAKNNEVLDGRHTVFWGPARPAETVGIKDQENQLVPEVVKQMLQDLGIPRISWFSCDRIVEEATTTKIPWQSRWCPPRIICYMNPCSFRYWGEFATTFRRDNRIYSWGLWRVSMPVTSFNLSCTLQLH